MIEKKILLLMNFHVLYVLELKKSKKMSARPPVHPSARLFVRPSVCLSVCMLGRLKNLSGCPITFQGVSASKQDLVGAFYV